MLSECTIESQKLSIYHYIYMYIGECDSLEV